MTIATIISATKPELDAIGELAHQLQVDSIRASTSAGSGHPMSSMSAADLLAMLIGRHLRYDWDNPKSPSNDHLIFSKGHAVSHEIDDEPRECDVEFQFGAHP